MMKQFSYPPSTRETAALTRNGSLSPATTYAELTERIKEHNETLKALREVMDIKTEHLQPLTETSGARLAGTFFTAKDSIPVTGLSLSYGTSASLLSTRVESADLITRLEAEGARCIGKANMAEYGKSYLTESSILGATSFPFDTQFNAGGSSGGDAASVAAGLCHFAVATDAGGSIRVPANVCGLFGILPTPGSISEAGLLSHDDPIASLFRRIGFITRDLNDLELLTSVAQSYNPHDCSSFGLPTFGEHIQKKRFLVVRNVGEVEASEEICSELEKVATQLQSLGYARVDETPREFEHCLKPFGILAGQAALLIDGRQARKNSLQRGAGGRRIKFWKALSREIDRTLPKLTPESVMTSWHSVLKLRRRITRVFEDVDFIIAPVGATGPLKHGTLHTRIRGKEYSLYHAYQFSSAINVCGLPAIAFPTSLGEDRLPRGLQIIGPRFQEKRLFEIVRVLGYTRSVVEQLSPSQKPHQNR